MSLPGCDIFPDTDKHGLSKPVLHAHFFSHVCLWTVTQRLIQGLAQQLTGHELLKQVPVKQSRNC
jgi:hypothetical protein